MIPGGQLRPLRNTLICDESACPAVRHAQNWNICIAAPRASTARIRSARLARLFPLTVRGRPWTWAERAVPPICSATWLPGRASRRHAELGDLCPGPGFVHDPANAPESPDERSISDLLGAQFHSRGTNWLWHVLHVVTGSEFVLKLQDKLMPTETNLSASRAVSNPPAAGQSDSVASK